MNHNIDQLGIRMTPHMNDEYLLTSCDVEMILKDPALPEGAVLADIWKEVAWVPVCEFAEPGLRAEDAGGALDLTLEEKKDKFGFGHLYWNTGRATSGDVTIRYTFIPQGQGKFTRSHPFFDTIPEKNGALIPGVTSLINVPDRTYKVELEWDLSDTPEGTRAACTYGEGNVQFEADCQTYTFNIMIVGRLKGSESGGKYRVWWLDDELPDKEHVEKSLPVLLQEIFNYFHEQDSPYSVFFRKEPYEISGGGTQFPGAFVYGYSEACPLNMEEALNTLAHETVHRWTKMENLKGEGVWFNEGMAEYYSMLIPLKSGLAGPERVAEWLTKKGIRYYSNPYQTMDIEEVYEQTWKDSRNRELQEAPYGRGLFYLIETDYQMKQKYDGKKTLDDLIFPMIETAGKKGACHVSDWEETLKNELGYEAVNFFRDVLKGRYISPRREWFDGAFTFEKGRYELRPGEIYDDAVIWKTEN